MATTEKNTVKNWFKTGLKPTQSQFWAWMDSWWHKNEKIPLTAIDDIEGILNAKAEASVVSNHLNDPNAHAELFENFELKSEKGQAGGYAPLDEFGILLSTYLNLVNDLVTGGIDAVLTAEQGKNLQNQINGINVLLSSDDVNLDTVQELVDAIKEVETSLSTILVNDLTTGGVTKALTAEQGKILKTQINELGSLINTKNYTISASQTTNIIQISFKEKVSITSLEGIMNVTSFSDLVIWKGNTIGTVRTTLASINADIVALSSAETTSGYTFQFKINLIAGQSNASAILKASLL